MQATTVGTYVLALWLGGRQRIAIGRLGEFELPPGWYLYVGSALGPGGLRARLGRHRRRLGGSKRPHWHIDYVREWAVWGGAWVRGTAEVLECEWATALRYLPGATIVVPRFGASDCRCPAHLLHVAALPAAGWFTRMLGAEKVVVDEDLLKGLLARLVGGDGQHPGSDEERESAAVALGGFGLDAVAPLAAILAQDDAERRWWAARALAEVGVEQAVGPLLGALADLDPDVRACAALALGRLGAGMAAAALASRLGDESAFVASIASDALSMIGEPAVEALTEAMAEAGPHSRLLAVRALGRIRSQKAIGPLLAVLEDPSYLVRYYAREALEAQGVGMVFFTP